MPVAKSICVSSSGERSICSGSLETEPLRFPYALVFSALGSSAPDVQPRNLLDDRIYPCPGELSWRSSGGGIFALPTQKNIPSSTWTQVCSSPSFPSLRYVPFG